MGCGRYRVTTYMYIGGQVTIRIELRPNNHVYTVKEFSADYNNPVVSEAATPVSKDGKNC